MLETLARIHCILRKSGPRVGRQASLMTPKQAIDTSSLECVCRPFLQSKQDNVDSAVGIAEPG